MTATAPGIDESAAAAPGVPLGPADAVQPGRASQVEEIVAPRTQRESRPPARPGAAGAVGAADPRVGSAPAQLDDADPIPTIGVEEVDRQHRVLELRWQILHRAQRAGDRRTVRANLWFLERYSAEHFTAEERLMRRAGYPELERHRHEHERFSERLRRLRLEVDAGRDFAEATHFEWLRAWFPAHVRADDARLARFLAEREGRGAATSFPDR